jgi:hypothetical protein
MNKQRSNSADRVDAMVPAWSDGNQHVFWCYYKKNELCASQNIQNAFVNKES